MDTLNRRTFLDRSAKTIVTLGAAGAALTAATPARADKANDKIVLGMIGLGGRGRDHANYFARRDDVELKYVCDVDLGERVGNMPRRLALGKDKTVPQAVQDMRVIFDDKDVDAVCIATCDHWHALATIWACQAGKDVYVEKPTALNMFESRKMIEAARKYNRIVQAGTQNRTAPYIRKAVEYIQSGAMGKVSLVKVYNMKEGGPYACPPDSEQPKDVNYDLYLGPAPTRPFNRGHFHDGWKMYWDYSRGDIGDDSSHQLDIARWLIGDKPSPKAVNCSGGHIAFHDDREVPDTLFTTFEYDDVIMTLELTQWTPYEHKAPGNVRDNDLFPDWMWNGDRIEIYGSREFMFLGRHGGGWQAFNGRGEVTNQEFGRQVSNEHRDNFLECVRSRNLPNADIAIAHQSVQLVHLASIGAQLGGRRLVFDGETESFPNDPEANALCTRVYREPFVVPETV